MSTVQLNKPQNLRIRPATVAEDADRAVTDLRNSLNLVIDCLAATSLESAATAGAAIDTIVNVGAGVGNVFRDIIATTANLKTLAAGTNMAIVDNADDITISTSAEINSGANVGAGTGQVFRDKTGVSLNFKTLLQGAGITITNNADDITIANSSPGVTDHGALTGLSDDDHPNHVYIPGRAGGQGPIFGGTGALEELVLRGSTAADLGTIVMQSPVEFESIALSGRPYAFNYDATEVYAGAFVGGGLNMSGTITFSDPTFIYESFRGAPTITTAVAPGFAAYTVLQALPLFRAGTVAGHRPLSPLVLNAAPILDNPFVGTQTTPTLVMVAGSPQVRASLSGAVMNVTTTTGLTFSPKFSTVAGSTIDFGTVRGLHVQVPAVGLFQPAAGTEAMTAMYGVDVANLGTFGGTVPKAALRSAIAFDTNAFFIQNTGGAWSDFGAGFAQWDDDAGVIFGSGTDVFIRWNSVQLALEYNTFFGMGNSPVFFRPNGDNSWDFISTNPLGLKYEVDNVSFGTASAAPGAQNWFVNYRPLADRQPNAAGSYSDIFFEAGGNLDINGLTMTNVQTAEFEAQAIVLSGGTIDDLSNVFVNSMATAGATRMQAWRVLGRTRLDGLLTHNEASLSQLTADVAALALPADNAGRYVLLQDADALGPWTIQGIVNVQVGDAVYIINDGANAFDFGHQDGAAAAADRIITPSGDTWTLGPGDFAKLWYDPVATRWRILETNAEFTKTLHLSGDQFRKGATAPTDVTVGTTPTVKALRFAATNELASLYHSFPVDLDKTQDIILRLQWSLVDAETNLDTLDISCDYVAITLATGGGLAKASTAITGQVTAVTGRLAAGDIYEMDLTFTAGDATNPLASAVGIAFEIHLTNITGVTRADLIDGDFIYKALY